MSIRTDGSKVKDSINTGISSNQAMSSIAVKKTSLSALKRANPNRTSILLFLVNTARYVLPALNHNKMENAIDQSIARETNCHINILEYPQI